MPPADCDPYHYGRQRAESDAASFGIPDFYFGQIRYFKIGAIPSEASCPVEELKRVNRG